MSGPRIVVVVGNPKPGSRTLAAGCRVAAEFTPPGTQPDLVLDLGTLGPALLDRRHPDVTGLVSRVAAADLLVVASPTYKGSYTGLLKVFLDHFPSGNGLGGLAVPLMLGAADDHALAPELCLRPVLTELGATVPGRGLFIRDHRYDDPDAYRDWLSATAPVITDLLSHPAADRTGVLT